MQNRNIHTETITNYSTNHQLLRMARDLVNAIEQSPGTMHAGSTIIKTKSRKPNTAFVNKQKIAQLVELRFRKKYPLS